MARADETKFWTTSNYIMAALGGTLAATAVVSVFSVVLSPAEISFSIVQASNRTGNDGTWYLNLTANAANASRKRVAVCYLNFFIGLQNSMGNSIIYAQVYVRPPAAAHEYLPPGAPPAIVDASMILSRFSRHQLDLVRNRGLTVVVEARVRFRVGGIPTRLYNIKVFCPHVFFPVEGSHNSPAAPPVDCGA